MANDLARSTAPAAQYAALRPVVIQSWDRSRAAGLDRHAAPSFRRVAQDDLERRLSANRVLLELSIPHLRWLSEWFGARPHVAYLVDAEGVVLHSEGDRASIELYRLSPGFDWSEAVMGTNGAGTALASRIPVAVIGCEHWATAWKDATCLGAPILDREGRPVGAIDISMAVQEGDAERLVVAAHVAYTVSQELGRYEAEAQSRALAGLYDTARAALEAERQARAEAEAASERTRSAEAELREHQARLQTIIDSTPAVVYVVDAADRFQLINRRFAELFSIDPDAAVGHSLFEYFPRDVAAQFATNNRDVLERRVVREFEEAVAVGGAVRTYLSVKAPLYDATGTAYAVCGVSTDITERKRLGAALELAQRQKDAFIATLAHELRQPLGAIQAALAVMQARIGRPQGERARQVVERQTNQLGRMVEDLLDAARLAQGKVTLRRERIALNDILDSVVHVAESTVHEKRLHLFLDVPREPVVLDADPARLQQVFSNLLMNAVKFTPPEGRIDIAAEPLGDVVRVQVRDTGKGIPADVLPHVFELFTQAAHDEGGLGIGLAVVRALVEQHGGTVEALSTGVGHGSQFVVTLPLVDGRA
jgi:PAS domain S-box-containing protein